MGNYMDQNLAKDQIRELVNKYVQVKDSGKLNSYTEEDTKKGFIEPFFEILGWNIRDRDEVYTEENIKSAGRVDYSFFTKGRAKFYLEAKPLKSDLDKEEYAKQAVRYAWNKGINWAVLTDFESIKVFYSQDIEASLWSKLLFEISYDQFVERFEQLWYLSKEAFEKDAIDSFAERRGKKLKKVSVDEKLYKDLNDCRALLSDKLSQWNPKVSKDLLDEGVQKLLDRLIFLRVAEDRGIEENTLIPLIRQWDRKENLYQFLIYKFRELDKIYNSNLFSPHPFEEWKEYSDATEKVINILKGRPGYYEYDFRVMPADVLGTVYENYLGYQLSQSRKGINLDKSARKRKDQGIYYTPTYIVDHIVKNALKPILDKCKSVDDLKRIKVLDPACGSGSFLIKVLEIINEKYIEFGNKGDELTKIQILEENIYGVDLDEKAVEITRLNLLLNTLEEKRKLPTLNHIKHGNSLISGTDTELEKYFGSGYRREYPFNWEDEFPEVFKQGGFDVIIGNPPYGVNFDLGTKKYLQTLFPNVPDKEIYIYFISRGLGLLNDRGRLSYIFPNTFLSNLFGVKYRKYLLDNFTIDSMTDLSEDNTFQGVSVRTCIVNFLNCKPNDDILSIYNFNPRSRDFIEKQKIPSEVLYANIENWLKLFTSSLDGDKLIQKIKSSNSVEISEVCEVSQGLIPYDKYRGHDENTIKNRIWHSELQKDSTYRKELKGADVSRYNLIWNGKLWISYGDWLAAPRDPKFFRSPRILVREIVRDTLNCTLTEEEFYNTPSIINILSKNKSFSLYFILAILNSKLIGWYHKKLSPKANKGLFPKILINDIRKIPIPKLDLGVQKKLIGYSDQMLTLHEKLNEADSGSNKWNEIKSEIEKVDRKIDEEVYKLYGLTLEEVTMVEKIPN
jgi:type I restriction-modification system DNA methylase subunit